MIAKYRYQAYTWMIAGTGAGILLGIRLIKNLEQPHRLLTVCVLVLSASAGLITGRVAAMITANILESKKLNILYRQRDPKRFIAAYEKGLRLCRPDLVDIFTTTNNLANAHAMMGEFSKAIELLENLNIEKLHLHQLGIESLITNSLTNWYLWSGETQKANEGMESLRRLAKIAQKRQPLVATNLQNNLKLFEQHLNVLSGESIDMDFFSEIISHTENPVFNQPVRLLFGMGLSRTSFEKASSVLTDLAGEWGDFWFVRQADQLLKKAN